MRTDHPLTITVEQAGRVLGVGRSTAYELVATGDIPSIRLRRRIVVPVAKLADLIGVERSDVWTALCGAGRPGTRSLPGPDCASTPLIQTTLEADTPTLF